MGFWQRRAVDGIRGAAEAFYPTNDLGAPDWQQTEMIRRTLLWVGDLPPEKGRLVLFLFALLELAAPLLTLSGRRFSRLAPERRTRAVTRWRRSGIYWLRVLGDAVKAAMVMIYLSHPDVIRYIGQYTHCPNPDDALQMPVGDDPFGEVTP